MRAQHSAKLARRDEDVVWQTEQLQHVEAALMIQKLVRTWLYGRPLVVRKALIGRLKLEEKVRLLPLPHSTAAHRAPRRRVATSDPQAAVAQFVHRSLPRVCMVPITADPAGDRDHADVPRHLRHPRKPWISQVRTTALAAHTMGTHTAPPRPLPRSQRTHRATAHTHQHVSLGTHA